MFLKSRVTHSSNFRVIFRWVSLAFFFFLEFQVRIINDPAVCPGFDTLLAVLEDGLQKTRAGCSMPGGGVSADHPVPP